MAAMGIAPPGQAAMRQAPAAAADPGMLRAAAAQLQARQGGEARRSNVAGRGTSQGSVRRPMTPPTRKAGV